MIKLDGGWAEARRRLTTTGPRLQRAMDLAVLREAHYLRGKMASGLQSQSPGGQPLKPHSSYTALIRSAQGFAGRKILIRSATMLGSIMVTKIAGGAFIGIKRGSPRGSYRLAQLHEQGATARQPWTERQRRWWFAMLAKAGRVTGGFGGGGSHTVKIPARPFISPTMDLYAQPEDVARRLSKTIAAQLGGDFGTP
jgi:hypothetical protein